MRKTPNKKNLKLLEQDYQSLINPVEGKKRIKRLLSKSESSTEKYLSRWYAFSKENHHVYPSQGLLMTPYDGLSCRSLQLLPEEVMVKTLRMRRFFLELFNHPYRVHHLHEANRQKFIAPVKVSSHTFDYAKSQGLSLSIRDLGARVVGSGQDRISRKERYARGPFVKLGKRARTFFLGSSSPDVWNSAAGIATMAASHCIGIIPRNGLTADVKRQVDLAKETFEWLELTAREILDERDDKEEVLEAWKSNVMGTLGANPQKDIERARALYKIGVKAFRVYSPEPGTGPCKTVEVIRKEFGEDIEIFAGQVVDVTQAKKIEEAGADAIVVGIGGGGRCITGVRSGSLVDWPSLIWSLRGELGIPVIADGGATEHVATTLLLGASGLMTSRVVAGGTIESPGGALFCSDENGNLFKPYGGEASARTKFLDGKLLPFDIPSFVEGEVTKAYMKFVKFVYPTLTYNLHLLIEDAILALVFRGAENIQELHAIDPSPLRRNTDSGIFQRSTH